MWKTLQDFFSNVGHAILSFTSNLATTIAKNGGPALVAAAEAEVAAAEEAAVAAITSGNKMTGEDKFLQAQAAVIKNLTAQGIPVVMNAVNGAIEAAVANLPANAAKTTAGAQ